MSGASLSDAITPACGSQKQSLSEWEARRDGHTQPLHVSAYDGSEAYRDEFVLGMEVLGFSEIHPQQMVIADACNAVRDDGTPLHPFMAVDVPRRSGKSESVTALAIGRCLSRAGYRVAVTFATTGTKLATRWKTDIFGRLEAWASSHYGDEWPFTLTRSNGHEAVMFKNGSALLLLPPKQSSYRSEAFDLILIDESGEASAALSEELMQAVGPTMDTRPHAQLIVAGTPAEFRKGNLLWDAIEAAISGEDADAGVVKYGVANELALEDIETWDAVEPYVLRAHPGVGTLTTLEKVRRNYNRVTPLRFAQEYLGQFGRDATTTGALNPAKWTECETTAPDGGLPTLPAYFTVGMAVAVDQSVSCLVAAWREDGVAHVGVLEHRPGSAWLPDVVEAFAAKYPLVPIAYDDKGPVVAEVEKIRQRRKGTKLERRTWANVTTAAALFTREVHTGKLKHYGQRELTEAALVATQRVAGDRAFAFGRPDPDSLIVALEAASLALHLYDEKPARQRVGIIAA